MTVGIAKVTQAINETAKGIQSIVGNVTGIGAVTQQTSANTQSVATTVEEPNSCMDEI